MATTNRGRAHSRRLRESFVLATMLAAGFTMVLWSMAIAAGLT